MRRRSQSDRGVAGGTAGAGPAVAAGRSRRFGCSPERSGAVFRRTEHMFDMSAAAYTWRLMPDFKLVADFKPTGDQPAAIDRLADGLANGLRHQTLLGATGTGKTATIAWTIERHQRPTLVLAHNKTLAAQLYSEFREFFPDNAVEYFVSYFDYYQPEAYLPRSDTYIEKDSSRNDEIDKLRHAATHALFERRDVIIVASVSCI